MKKSVLYVLCLLFVSPLIGCSSNDKDRSPASYYSRAGREYKEPRAMNHRRLDTDAMYNSCLRERSELYCRNRMGR